MAGEIENGPLITRVREMERQVGQGHWAEAASYFAPDVSYQIGRRGRYTGIQGIRSYMEWQRRFVEWRGHDPRMMITHGETVIIEVVSLFRRLNDGVDLAIPCTDIYRFDGDRIREWSVYADTSCFFAQHETPVAAPKETTT